MHAWQEWFVDAVLRHRMPVVAVTALITIAAGAAAVSLEFDSSIDIWFLRDDPAVVTYHNFLERFDADEVSVVAVFADDVFNPDTLAAIERLTIAAEEAPFTHRVTSLTNVRVATGDDGAIAIAPLIAALPSSADAVASLRASALENRLLVGSLIAEDGRAAAIVIELAPEGADFTGKVEHVEALMAAIAVEVGRGVDVRLTGTPPFDEAFFRLSRRDFIVLAPAAIIVLLLSILIVFRRFSAVMVPVAVVLISVVWVFGVMALFDLKLNVISSGLTAVILAVGIADTVHVLTDYYQELRLGLEPRAAVRQSILNLLVPCLVTSATTAVGMLALLVSSLQPIREFGALAATGVIFAFVLSVTFAPALLTLSRPPDPAFVERQANGPVSRLLAWLGRVTPQRSRVVALVGVACLAAGVWGISTLEIGANSMNYFREDSPIRRDTEIIDRAMGGSATIELVVTAPDEGLKDPAVLRSLDELERWLEARHGFSGALSAVDSLKEMNRVFRDGEPEQFRVPESRALAAQLFLMLEGEDDFESMVQDDYSVARITSRVQMTEAAEIAHDVPAMDRHVDEVASNAGIDIVTTGFVKLMHNMEVYLLDSQIRSLSIAFVVITLMLMLLLRSVKLGLFSMIPNFLPVLLGLAFMGWAGIDLDPGTVMIGAIALGLVVDDSVHFLVRLRRRVAELHSLEAAIDSAMRDAGRPIIITSLLLSAGFSILALGSFSPNINFGLVAAWVVMVALVADLLLLPAALVLVRPRL